MLAVISYQRVCFRSRAESARFDRGVVGSMLQPAVTVSGSGSVTAEVLTFTHRLFHRVIFVTTN